MVGQHSKHCQGNQETFPYYIYFLFIFLVLQTVLGLPHLVLFLWQGFTARFFSLSHDEFEGNGVLQSHSPPPAGSPVHS